MTAGQVVALAGKMAADFRNPATQQEIIRKIVRFEPPVAAYLSLKVHNLIETQALKSRFRRLIEVEALRGTTICATGAER